MALGKSKWIGRISELSLPRPRLLDVPSLDSAAAEQSLLLHYAEATSLLANPSAHFVTRWEGVSAYAENLDSYSKLLATHAALADVLFMESPTSMDDDKRQSRIAQLVNDPSTRSNGLAASLSFATLIAAMATALSAYAIKDPGRASYEPAATALRTADLRLAEFEALERQNR